ncbi:hypothetical protein [Flagellimonas iocasae]|uniref:Uncharacterized protein n=1 Tax=Flagellimonas iocasae TaxID=2055905 RepID=A0ABW4Y2T8_9FLAO
MKKLFISSLLVLAAFALWGPMNAFQKKKVTATYSSFDKNADSLYSAKYRDCIMQSDFPEGSFSNDKIIIENDWDLMKVNSSINRYGQSLDSTIKNLNAIDAHNFLHHEFERSKNTILNSKDLSWIRAHYLREIMRICYDNDRLLNLGSGNNPHSL